MLVCIVILLICLSILEKKGVSCVLFSVFINLWVWGSGEECYMCEEARQEVVYHCG